MTKKWKRTSDELLRVARYPRATQHCVDYDYVDKLTEEEKLWLAEFTDMIYNNTNNTEFFGIDNTDNQYMREIYKETNARNKDLYNLLKGGHLLDSLDGV